MLNGYCFTTDNRGSFMYDYPKEYIFYQQANCTGPSSAIDMTLTMNSCLPMTTTVGSANSFEYLYVKH